MNIGYAPACAGRSRIGLQAGVSLPEVMIAVSIAFSLLILSGYVFVRQANSYSDLKKSAAVQADIKKSMQAMTRQISNSGGWLGNPRSHFVAKPDRIAFAYFDLGSRYCPSPDTVIMSFSIKSRNGGDALVQEYRCGSSPWSERKLVSAPRGDISLAFQYLDRKGALTGSASQAKAVRVSMGLRGARSGKLPPKIRYQAIQVDLVNL